MKKLSAFILAVLTVISLCSCFFKPKKELFNAYYFDWFDTVTVISGYEQTRAEFDKTVKKTEPLFSKYHKLYDIYNKYEGVSNLALINEIKNGVHSEIGVDKEIIDLLDFSKNMYNKTNGKLNVAMGSVLSVWHTYRENGKKDPENAALPGKSELKSASLHCNIDDLIINNEKNTVFLKDSKMSLDVGAVAKGYACEEAAAFLESLNKNGYIINAGGNIRTVGKKENNADWIVGVENPNKTYDSKPFSQELKFNGSKALSTSGSYQRFYTVNGKKYHHIIDPETLFPNEQYISVSVISDSSAVSDALSTALFNMSYKEGISVLENFPDAEALWITKDSKKLYSKNMRDYLY